MDGLFFVISKKEKVNFDGFRIENQDDKHICYSYEAKNLFISCKVLNKFQKDKIFVFDAFYCICFDGVILNLDDLLKKYNHSNITDLLIHFHNECKLLELISQFRGSFSGIFFDRKTSTVEAFCDHFASRTMFYYSDDNWLIIASEVDSIATFMKNNNIESKIDDIAIYSLMTYGYMLNDHTLIRGVHRIHAGTLIYIDSDYNISKKIFYCLKQKQIDVSFDEAIERVDELFCKSVELQYKKNNEYKYINVVPLSAGMDCRMTAFAYRRITDDPLVCFTYSETGEQDFLVPAKMSHDLKCKWIFKSLDNGLDLERIDESIDISDSLIKYDWAAQLNDFLCMVNCDDWGIVHTGVIGDVVLGTFQKNKKYDREYRIGDGAFSTMLIDELSKRVSYEEIQYQYEEGMIINRAINGACLGYTTSFRKYAENLSPFMNVDFYNYCSSLPIEYRQNHKIYYEWVKRKFPKAANYKHNGIGFKGNISFKYKGRDYRIRSLIDVVINKIKRDYIHKGYGMNPQQTWYDENSGLKDVMDNYFEENIQTLKKEEFCNDLKHLYNDGSVTEKILAISVVGSYKKFFGEENK